MGAPLREAISQALQISAVASSRDVDASPVLALVDGRPAVDLELFGRAGTGGSPVRDRVRRIAASWRLGRLRGALPAAGRRVATRTDAELADLDPLTRYTDDQLLDLLDRAGRLLRTLHGHEILIGLISEPGEDALTGTGVALRLLGRARREGLDDADAVAREPAILALCPPRIGRPLELPDITDVPDRPTATPSPDSPGVLREVLRMRVRWVHELTARAAEELGRRLADEGLLTEATDVRHVALDDLRAAVISDERPRLRRGPVDTRLPNRFRLTAQRDVVPERGDDGGGAVGAGGGSATGPAVVLHDGDLSAVADGSVLVVDDLGPELAPVLGRIAGLVSETGSPLSHIAILARESGVATVVAMDAATQRFADGGQLTVDGAAGTVEEAAA